MVRIERLLCGAAVLAAASFGCGEKAPPAAGEAVPSLGPVGEEGQEKERRAPRGELSAGTPQEAFVAAQEATRTRDFGALFDLLSKEAREKFIADLKSDAESAATAPFVTQVLGFSPVEASELPPRQAFVEVMKGGTEASSRLAAGVGLSAATQAGAKGKMKRRMLAEKVTSADVNEPTAILSVDHGDGSKGTVRLVLEDGKWRLAELP